MNPSNPTSHPPIPDNHGQYRGFVDAIRGPIMMIAIGVLMTLDQMDRFGIDRTWPALLILFGVLKLASYAGGTRE
jgi:hypothetical protein